MPEPLRSPLQIPKPGEKRAGQVGARGDSPAGEGDRPSCTPQSLAASARCALAPAPREQAQLQSLCLAQRSGRPVPRRPLRALLSLSMPRFPGAAQSARFPLDSTSCRAQSDPDPQAVPGGAQGTGLRERRARQPASQRPASPASLAPQPYSQCAAGAAVLKGPACCSLCAKPGGGWGAVPNPRLPSSRCRRLCCPGRWVQVSIFPDGSNPLSACSAPISGEQG